MKVARLPAPLAPGVMQRPKVAPEPPGGFRVKPTFEELADTNPLRAEPIRRDALTYFNSFEAAWLRGPIDEIRNKAQEIQTPTCTRLCQRKSTPKRLSQR